LYFILFRQPRWRELEFVQFKKAKVAAELVLTIYFILFCQPRWLEIRVCDPGGCGISFIYLFYFILLAKVAGN